MADWELAEILGREGIRDRRVLAAIAALERSRFVPQQSVGMASGNYPLPIGYGQTISQPYVVAYMSEALRLMGHERVLEIGTGSGYQAAVLSQLCAEVYTVEIIPELAASARTLLERELRLPNVFCRQGDGSLGWPEAAPFDAILLTAAPAQIPGALIEQLIPGGRLVAPVGEQSEHQQLVLVEKGAGDGMPRVKALLPVRFVPMTGEAQDPHA
ncbi:protein-L-isoaspartate(D-aspartate) O-methyltransferase [Aggregicoccus sp. 17bor-14]|uniref:protein-L-isoaspartate(D-aspartate) O-methyltransferase n=1 Tax=Myxococcaceae TaxID=31 RepID=UPI00129CC565|nr:MULTISPECIES: protein-L-isoaspartate(D-aspartate) O-methyltransferase [Myxococcaceae]MBF5043043.1 protein-L-isoaspartate(D-aspartate) O-methyltransferase [Simulacricoccus sp. 17bor-14]MRI88806.1 protein-L-isoaspartate(D-aspartate) O-methyltransferase [Aggregicoccus sp. 17bor-14]